MMFLQFQAKRGVTFYEIMMVSLVIAVLSIMVVMGTRRLLIDTRITRAREDQRAISRALQSYFVDYYSFPNERAGGLSTLQTPITYLAAIPTDVFARGEDRNQPYRYRTWTEGNQTVWIIASRGPDGDLDFELPPPVGIYGMAPSGAVPGQGTSLLPLPEQFQRLSFDPTNGLESSGDIFTLCPFVRH